MIQELCERIDAMTAKAIVLVGDRNRLYQTLSDLEAELRKAGTCKMEFYQRDRDHKMQAEFLKMADHAKATLDSITIEDN